MTHPLDYLIPFSFAVSAAIIWLIRRRTRLPQKSELAPPPRPAEPESQEIEKLILRMDEAMLTLDAAGEKVPRPGEPDAPAPDSQSPPPQGLL